jgi:hypothetical protein
VPDRIAEFLDRLARTRQSRGWAGPKAASALTSATAGASTAGW